MVLEALSCFNISEKYHCSRYSSILYKEDLWIIQLDKSYPNGLKVHSQVSGNFWQLKAFQK